MATLSRGRPVVLTPQIGVRNDTTRADRFDEAPIDREIELCRIPVSGHGAERVLTHLLQQRLVDRGKAAEDLHLVAVLA